MIIESLWFIVIFYYYYEVSKILIYHSKHETSKKKDREIREIIFQRNSRRCNHNDCFVPRHSLIRATYFPREEIKRRFSFVFMEKNTFDLNPPTTE